MLSRQSARATDELTMTVANVLVCGKHHSSIVSDRRIFSVSTLLFPNSQHPSAKITKMTLKIPS